MKTLMITGAGGVLGTSITRQFAKDGNYKIVAVTSGRHPVRYSAGVIAETANLLDEAEQKALLNRVNPDIIIHLSWSLDGPSFLESEKNIQWLEASFSLLRAFQGECFAFAGSSAEYGEGAGCKETDTCHPTSLYGECKLAFERVAAPYCKSKGIRFVGMRFFSVYGAGDHRLGRALPTAIKAFQKSEPFICTGPNNTWDYIYNEDIGRAVTSIIYSNYIGTVNVSSGTPTSMKEVFTTLSRLMGAEELLSFENENKAGSMLFGENRILREIIGFTDFTPLEVGLKKTIANWK